MSLPDAQRRLERTASKTASLGKMISEGWETALSKGSDLVKSVEESTEGAMKSGLGDDTYDQVSETLNPERAALGTVGAGAAGMGVGGAAAGGDAKEASTTNRFLEQLET